MTAFQYALIGFSLVLAFPCVVYLIERIVNRLDAQRLGREKGGA